MDPRKILGVDGQATPDEITRAYREKIRKHHPDLGGDAWAFQQVQEAYESLTSNRPSSSRSRPPSAANASQRPTTSHRATPDPTNSKQKTARQDAPPRDWRHLFVKQLPLQNETTIFILINVFDIFMTYILLRFGAIESNPIANFVYQVWGFRGMIAFKLCIVAFVCVVAQVVALSKFRTAQFLLISGTMLTGGVVVYSALLFAKNYSGF